MFMLPPLPAAAAAEMSADVDTSATSATSTSALDHSGCSSASDDSSVACSRNAYNINLATIDVTGKRFLSLPADVRHDILTDLKAMRKESSWDRLHELPVQRDQFSDFQMRRLLKRRQVQQSLEQAEQEMGGSSLSLGEIERLLCEDGVVDAESLGAMAKQRVMSDENRRILHVRNLREALKEEKRGAKMQLVEEETPVEVSGEASPPKKVKLEVLAIKDAEDEVNDDDEELQRAIQMSLEEHTEEKPSVKESAEELGSEFDIELQQAIKMSMSTDRDAVQEISSSDSADDVSSNADSDFVEVPDATDDDSYTSSMRPSQLSFETNIAPSPDASMDFRHADLQLQVVIDPTTAGAVDDLFADVFVAKEEKSKPIDVQEMQQVLGPETTSVSAGDDLFADELVAEEEQSKPTQLQDVLTPSAADLDAILNRVNAELESIKMRTYIKPLPDSDASKKADGIIDLADDDSDEPTPTKLKQSDIAAYITVTPTKKKTPPSTDATVDTTPPPKVPTPFFHKKTPASSGKKSTASSSTSPRTSSAKKSLFPPPAGAEPAVAESAPVDPAALLDSLAGALREATTADELAAMAASARQTTNELLHERNKQDRLGLSITDRMSDDCQRLLRMFGIPFVVAPMEAEAQCAYLNAARLTDGTITDDSDIWLFGGRTVYRHFFDQDKHVQEFRADEVHRMFQVERGTLIQMAMLVGSDYTTGVPGIGTVTALEILSAFTTRDAGDKSAPPPSVDGNGDSVSETSLLESLQRFRDWLRDRNRPANRPLRNKLRNVALGDDFPRADVVQSYLRPDVRADLLAFSWRLPDAESLREFAKTTFGWTFARTDDTLLPVLRRLQEKRSQQSIRNYFATEERIDRREVVVSKRVRKAIEQMARPEPNGASEGAAAEVAEETDVKKPKRTRKIKATTGEMDVDTKPKATARKRNPRASNATQASASTSSGASPTKPKLPASRVPRAATTSIPQREKELAEQKKRREKAAEIFRQSQSANGADSKKKSK